jgi:hypothetical protein
MSVKVETLAFEKLLKDYAEIRETTIPQAVAINARLLCVELARRTQAFGEDEKVGTERVRKDISNIIKPPVYFLKFLSKTQSERLKKTLTKNFQSRNWPALKSTLSAVGMGGDAFTVVESGNFAGIHRENRNQKTGRTFKRPKQFYLAADSSSLFNYIKDRQKKVGLAKSGWAACAKQLPKVVSGSMTRGIPRWVTSKLQDFTFGRVEDRTSNIFNPVIVLTNTLPWADRVITPVEQLNATQIVARKMKNQMARILKSRTTKLAEAA